METSRQSKTIFSKYFFIKYMISKPLVWFSNEINYSSNPIFKKYFDVFFDEKLSEKETIFDGKEVGELAIKYFVKKYGEKKYKDLSLYSFNKNSIKLTNKIIENKKIKVMFEMCFEWNSFRTRPDILIRNKDNTFTLIEVKAVSNYNNVTHFWDVLYQYALLTRLGYKIREVKIMHINKEYYLPKKINVSYLKDYFSFLNMNLNDMQESMFLFLLEEIFEKFNIPSPYMSSYVTAYKQNFDSLYIGKIIKFTLYNEQNIFALKELAKICDSKIEFEQRLQLLCCQFLDFVAEDIKYIFNVAKYDEIVTIDKVFENINSLAKGKLYFDPLKNYYINEHLIEDKYDSVFNLYQLRLNKKLENHFFGIYKLTSFLNLKLLKLGYQSLRAHQGHIKDIWVSQAKALDAKNKIFFKRENIEKHLQKYENSLLVFMDFETSQYAFPRFEQTKGYQQICFQYSAHIIDNIDELKTKGANYKWKHIEYIANKEDTYFQFIDKFIYEFYDVLKQKRKKCKYIVYHQTFEKTRIKEMINLVKNKEKIKKLNYILRNILDLEDFFKKGDFWHKEFINTVSIKRVLPVLTKNKFKYDKLTIKDGSSASWEYKKYFLDLDYKTNKERDKLFKDLYKYCKLDTLAMVVILGEVIKLLETNK